MAQQIPSAKTLPAAGCVLNVWLAGILLLIVQRPLYSPDLWWHLARGRAVCEGTTAPASTLTVLDETNEADWLSGVPTFVTWWIGDVSLIALLPLLAAICLWSLFSRRLSRDLWWCVAGWPVFLWAVRDALQPGAELFDVAGLISLALLTESAGNSRKRITAAFFVMLCWSNLGPRPIWGILWLLARTSWWASSGAQESTDNRGRVWSLSAVISGLLGGLVSPRGVYSWLDSAILFAPGLFHTNGQLADTIWSPGLVDNRWTVAETAFLGLWSFRILQPILDHRVPGRRFSLPVFTEVAIPILAAVLSQHNIPMSAAWILCCAMVSRRESDRTHFVQRGLGAKSVMLLAGLAAAGLAVFDAMGYGVDHRGRLGWGVACQIDPRLVNLTSRAEQRSELHAWAPDRNSVGIVAWLNQGVKMVDHPQRALLAGRLATHVSLRQDLIDDHRARYPRDDGSWGGWVRPMRVWNVRLVCVPIADLTLAKALNRSTWRALDLDSATIPYASGEDPEFSSAILDSLQQQGFVELGPWQPESEIYDAGNWRWDVGRLLNLGPDPFPAIVQSRLFRTMDIPMASLRAILSVRKMSAHPALFREFSACQSDLAAQEWTTFGKASEFRQQVIARLPAAAFQSQTALMEQPFLGEFTFDPSWDACVDLYHKGQISDAARAVPGSSSEHLFAAAMLFLEDGDSAKCLSILSTLKDSSDAPAIRIASTYWHQQVSQFVEP